MRVKLGDICDVFDGPHATPPEAHSGPIFLGIKNINEQCELDFSDVKHLSESDFEKWTKRVVPQKDDIVFSYEATLNRYALIPEGFRGCLGRRLAIVRVKDPSVVNPHYLYFYFCSPKWAAFILANKVVGSTVLRVSVEDFPDYEIELPDIDVQNAIASLLDDISNKKRNNNSLCSDFRAMAKLLYDYWFVQFDFPDEHGKPYKSSGGKMVWNDELKREIPEGWEVGNLYDIAEYINGLACQKYRPFDDEHKLPVIKIGEMHDGFGSEVEWARDDVPSKHVIHNGDILFSWSASLEVMLWSKGTGVLNQHIFNVIPKMNKYYVFQQLSAYVVNFVRMAEARKTTMGHITTDHLSQSRIVIPPRRITDTYGRIVNDLYGRLISCSEENQQLTELRDFLLPMLMNGQVKIKQPANLH